MLSVVSRRRWIRRPNWWKREKLFLLSGFVTGSRKRSDEFRGGGRGRRIGGARQQGRKLRDIDARSAKLYSLICKAYRTGGGWHCGGCRGHLWQKGRGIAMVRNFSLSLSLSIWDRDWRHARAERASDASGGNRATCRAWGSGASA